MPVQNQTATRLMINDQSVISPLPKAAQAAESKFKTDKLISLLISLLIFLVPLFYLPIFSNYFTFPKSLLIFVFSSVILFLLALKRKPLGAGLLPILPLSLTLIVSILLSTNRYDALIASLPLLSLIYLYSVIVISARLKTGLAQDNISKPLFLSLSLLSVFAMLNFLNLKFFKLVLRQFVVLNPTGSALDLVLTLGGGLLIGAIPIILRRRKVNQPPSTTSQEVSPSQQVYLAAPKLQLIIICLGFLAALATILIQRPLILDPFVSWSVAAGAIGQSPQTALFGVGPGRYLTAFTRFRPLFFNNQPLWNVRFSAASNVYLHLLTEMGLLGLAGYLFLTLRHLKIKNLLRLNPGQISLAALLAIQLLLPSPFTFLFLFFLLLSLPQLAAPLVTAPAGAKANRKYLNLITSVILIILSLLPWFFLPKYALAEIHYQRALTALNDNRGTDAYNSLRLAIPLFPQHNLYHLTYSQVNLALANALAVQADLTDTERQQIIQLVQQAVREARFTVQSTADNVVMLENLANIYRNLFGFATNAELWATASYNQAINLDPFNALLRFDSGGFFYFVAQQLPNDDEKRRLFEEARNRFLQAANLQPHLANAFYNLSKTDEMLSDLVSDAQVKQLRLQTAITNMQQTVTLVCNQSETQGDNCQKATNELSILQEKLTKAQQSVSQPSSEQEVSINLPSELEASPEAELKPFMPQLPLEEATSPASQLPQVEITPRPVLEEKSGELEL